MKKYSFKEGAIDFKKEVDANIMGKALEKIEKKYGSVSPENILNEASKPKHPLHKCFEWDNTIAAQKWRERQAHSMLRILVVETDEIKEPIRAFVYIKTEKEGIYQDIEKALTVQESSDFLVEQAKREMDSWIKKYQHLKQLNAYFRVLKKVHNIVTV